jgi:uncharacterized protein (TIGR02246 family)
MKTIRSIAWLAVVTAMAAPPALACNDGGPAAGEVRAVAEGIAAADNARDIGRVLDYYAEDAILMPPGEPPVTDRAEIRNRYDTLFGGFDPKIETHVDEICVEGALAVVRGHNGGWLVAREVGRTRQLNDVYLMVLRRDPDGTWRITRLMWHPTTLSIR